MHGYKHVVNVAFCPAVDSDAPSFQQESARGKAAAQVSPSSKKAATYHIRLEGIPVFAVMVSFLLILAYTSQGFQ